MLNNSQFTKITEIVEGLDPSTISSERKEVLLPLIEYIQEKVANNQIIRLNFICTHNSRRSHLSQVWAQAMATYFNIDRVYSYSGGTEATAMFPMAAKTLSNQGFQIQKLSDSNNPVYAIKHAENEAPIIGFSKTFDSEFNPQSNFAAILTCSSADEGCPFIAGAEKRIPITFEDPKAFDNTPQQAEKYLERSIQIATELFYVFNEIKK
ncbi:arsenate-mycothiol transferase ArsC [Flavicella marina]|uniref:arsenate-mycothiol transferase ArsC n=1 Tax=Flavicella marina TaxID=1475951 RepID=UPI0012652A28|nr:protein-tyrosine-phosphatase [Flavicella marina]